jgi:hypothetical protein
VRNHKLGRLDLDSQGGVLVVIFSATASENFIYKVERFGSSLKLF